MEAAPQAPQGSRPIERENAAARGRTSFATLHDAAKTGQIQEKPDYSMGVSGSLDDVRIYRRVLSPADIATLAQP